MFFGARTGKPLDPTDPRLLSRAMLGFSLLVVLLSGTALLGGIHGERGTGDILPLRVIVFSCLYTLPLFLQDHWRWMRDHRQRAVAHILARDLSHLTLLASVFVLMFWGPLAGVVAFVLLRALNDSAELVPSYSLDGVSWTTTWREEWDPVPEGPARAG